MRLKSRKNGIVMSYLIFKNAGRIEVRTLKAFVGGGVDNLGGFAKKPFFYFCKRVKVFFVDID
jgi:hypothetical protein